MIAGVNVTLKLPEPSNAFVATGVQCAIGVVRLVEPSTMNGVLAGPLVPRRFKLEPERPTIVILGEGGTADVIMEIEPFTARLLVFQARAKPGLDGLMAAKEPL